MQITCTINQKNYSFESEPQQRVLDILRDHGMLSVKEGCGEGECGACSIYLNGRLVNACLLLAPQMQDAEIVTLEGLQKETETIRRNFVEAGAVQCGFCSPGMLMAAAFLLRHNPAPTETEIREAISGNLCRCTGYDPIVEGIRNAAEGETS
jgi:aerobic-type carbon monoxide dehydrogenase small subunit (CoxS/CutS family)